MWVSIRIPPNPVIVIHLPPVVGSLAKRLAGEGRGGVPALGRVYRSRCSGACRYESPACRTVGGRCLFLVVLLTRGRPGRTLLRVGRAIGRTAGGRYDTALMAWCAGRAVCCMLIDNYDWLDGTVKVRGN